MLLPFSTALAEAVSCGVLRTVMELQVISGKEAREMDGRAQLLSAVSVHLPCHMREALLLVMEGWNPSDCAAPRREKCIHPKSRGRNDRGLHGNFFLFISGTLGREASWTSA